MKTRLWIPDLIKGLSILFMVQDHIFETWIQQDLLYTDLGSVIRFMNNFPAAGIFMLCMGFTVGYTEAGARKLLRRGIKVFFWGFLLNIGLNLHYIIKILLKSIEGNIIDSLFAVDILYLAGLSLMILGVIKLLPHSLIISLVGAVTVALISPYITDLLSSADKGVYFFSFVAMPAANSFFPLFPWLSYSLAGYAFSQFLEKYPQLKTMSLWHYVLLVLVLISSGVGYVLKWNDLGNLPEYYHHGIKVFSWIISVGLAMTLLLYLFQNLQKGSFSAWVMFLGSKLTRIYVIQWLIIGNLATFFYQQLNLLMYFIGSIMVLGLSTIIIYLMKDYQFKIGNA